MQHGLNSNYKCFEVMVNQLTNNKKNNNYISLGYVTFDLLGSTIVYEDEFMAKLQSYFGLKATNTPNDYLSETINRLTDEGFNVLVRTGFSSGNLSFDTQLTQMSNMVEKFEGHNADVVFIGHSMGGLASINYGIDYAKKHSTEEVTIITISTPFTPNFYAMEVWNGTLQGNAAVWLKKQEKGYAHRDLGGFSDENDDNALENLKNKWITYKNGGGTAKLYTIAIGYKKYKNETGSGTKRGDGVVELYSQRGADWGYVLNEYILDTGKEISIINTNDDYFHSNTPKLLSVAEEVKKIIQ